MYMFTICRQTNWATAELFVNMCITTCYDKPNNLVIKGNGMVVVWVSKTAKKWLPMFPIFNLLAFNG